MSELTIEQARVICATEIMGYVRADREDGTWFWDNPKDTHDWMRHEDYKPDRVLKQAERLKAKLRELGYEYTIEYLGDSKLFMCVVYKTATNYEVNWVIKSEISENHAFVMAVAKIGGCDVRKP